MNYIIFRGTVHYIHVFFSWFFSTFSISLPSIHNFGFLPMNATKKGKREREREMGERTAKNLFFYGFVQILRSFYVYETILCGSDDDKSLDLEIVAK